MLSGLRHWAKFEPAAADIWGWTRSRTSSEAQPQLKLLAYPTATGRRAIFREIDKMVGIHGIGGVPEPKPERTASHRERPDTTPTKNGETQDAVVISSEAQAAARLTQLLQAAADQPDVRADKIAAAKAAIDRGDYQNPDVVRTVAERLNKYL